MRQIVSLERFFLIAHILTMIFGLAGLLIVLPHPELIAGLLESGQTIFELSMAGGGVSYIIFGTLAVALYAYRTLGLWKWLTFMIPAAVISLSSELLGTSTGFPFGEYGYLSGLGYKVAGLVPFTIPLSWFYMGFVCYLIARVAMDKTSKNDKKVSWLGYGGAIALGAILLTSWDFALDPAMSRTIYPFWHYGQEGAFFGTPYQNFFGWTITGAVFMTVAALFWQRKPVVLSRKQLRLPLAIYLSNITYSAVMAIAGAGLWIPVGLSVLLGVVPILVLWWMAGGIVSPSRSPQTEDSRANNQATNKVPVAPSRSNA
ncbi:MAG: gamma-carotene 1'-hydroxylase CruF [Coleofasciculaceae cyanobacterium]